MKDFTIIIHRCIEAFALYIIHSVKMLLSMFLICKLIIIRNLKAVKQTTGEL